ncbi:MAG: malic enzyme-like NAD(P)-binding protein, partial [Patescibacteria group bacterium]
ISDGSAVLGLGNVGPEAALPVMEGKCAIFKEFAGINAFPICLKTQDVDEIVRTVIYISPVFGGINLEDISAPRCFEIEQKLQKALDLPVMHDDQHATAIAVLAGLFNAVKIVEKRLDQCKIVIVGCGAAGTAIAKLLAYIKLNNIIMVDSQGIISKDRLNLLPYKQELAGFTNKKNINGDLEKAVRHADILIGVSSKNIITEDMIKSMHENPIVFAMANPDPEVSFNNACKWGIKVFATGRSDYPNQINNALIFPGLFQGFLKAKVTKITSQMKVNAAGALASLVRKPAPACFIPSIFDKRVAPTIAKSVTARLRPDRNRDELILPHLQKLSPRG